MSRSGRAIDVLTEWRDHPKGCTDKHGWEDGYDGPCTDDPWDIVQSINQIDTEFRTDEIRRLRAALQYGLRLSDYDHMRSTAEGRRLLETMLFSKKET